MKKKIVIGLLFIVIAGALLAGCTDRQAEKVGYNISKEADNFNVVRRLIATNMRTDKIMFEVTGTFSMNNNGANELEIICKTGANEYKKHFIYINEQWTSYTVEDISGSNVDPYKYQLIWYPEMIVPITVKQGK